MIHKPACIFCQITRQEAEASFVYQDDLVSGFMDIRPVIKGHLLVVPNAHFVNLAQLEDAYGSRMFSVARKLAQAIRASELQCEGVNIYLADGSAAGQTVFHVHLHVIPRFSGDGFKIHLPPSYGELPDREHLNHVAEQIRSGMK